MPDYTVNVRFRTGGGLRTGNLLITADNKDAAARLAPADGRRRGMDVTEVISVKEEPPYVPQTDSGNFVRRPGDMGVGVIWYNKDDWPIIRKLIPSLVPETYEEWYKGASSGYIGESISGNSPDIIKFDPEEYEDFCMKGGVETDWKMSMLHFCAIKSLVFKGNEN